MTEKQHSHPTTDIAIIGAGISGAYCASLLSSAGMEVCLVEKSRGTGGRSSSKRVSNTESCDLGAPFFHISHPSLQAVVQQWVSDEIVAPWVDADTENATAYTGIPKMSAITRHLIQNSTIINNCRVHYIERSGSEWTLRDDSYNVILSCNTLIVTAPASQTCPLLATPYIPNNLLLEVHKASALSRPQWSMLLTTQVNETAKNFSQARSIMQPSNHSVVERIIFDSRKPLRPDTSCNWIIQARSEWSEHHIDANEEAVKSTLSQAFFDITGLQGDPVLCHRWLLARHSPINGMPSRWEPNYQIGLAADWLCKGDVEGALLSAQHLCNTILSEYKSQ
ncbi:NAD(P)/FAD-dependent oxidoreductase [Marinomonas sp. 2405UD68-3]|uniref:NAD(P)/FAD-dependent oxidoreductase n=1 Tax=Marinomonas sp. 2405UD68-3 TaxID=3391835 RepID=UPI0039C90F8F